MSRGVKKCEITFQYATLAECLSDLDNIVREFRPLFLDPCFTPYMEVKFKEGATKRIEYTELKNLDVIIKHRTVESITVLASGLSKDIFSIEVSPAMHRSDMYPLVHIRPWFATVVSNWLLLKNKEDYISEYKQKNNDRAIRMIKKASKHMTTGYSYE